MTKEELLEEEEIKGFMKTHVGAADDLRRAAEILVDNRDSLKALKKILPVLESKVVNVFFSYKEKKDKDAVETIVKILCAHGGRNLKITHMGLFGEKCVGQDYKNIIKKAISEANLFILLFPDPSDDWDWCLYEAGLFEGYKTSADRLICIHHPLTTVPTQIDAYQAVPANEAGIQKFLTWFFINDDPVPGVRAINPNVREDINKLAKEIIDAIRAPIKPDMLIPYIELSYESNKEVSYPDDLDNAKILSYNNDALDIFGFHNNPKTWGNLRSKLPEQESRWRNELCTALPKIAIGAKTSPVNAVFKNESDKIFRPIVSAANHIGDIDGPITSFQVVFIEDVGALDTASLSEEIMALASLHRFCFRFRCEILDHYCNSNIKKSDVDKLENAFSRMRNEWHSRGSLDIHSIKKFFSPAKWERISVLLMIWQNMRNDQGTGKLDQAIASKDTREITNLLQQMRPHNREFLEIINDRFSELVSR